MTDLAQAWLTQRLSESEIHQSIIWCLDENTADEWRQAPVRAGVQLISNRWDLAESARLAGWPATFSDFDLNHIDDESQDVFLLRVAKEKAVTHHLLNQAWRCLKHGGVLCVAGYKQEGVKTYIDKISKLLGSQTGADKEGTLYTAQLRKTQPFVATSQLDDNHYGELRLLDRDTPQPIYTKPGQFGWNKIDKGSALLIEHLALALEEVAPVESCADLGCGYGYLSLAASQLAPLSKVSRWIATDNNAAAIISARENLRALGATVLADNCAAQVATAVDLVLCNPPFHQGFDIDGELTDRFLAAARRLTRNSGIAVFVVNQFIPIERKATRFFRHLNQLASDGSFKVIRLRP